MTKSTITKIWVAGLIVIVAGLAIGGTSLGLMLANAGHWDPVPGTNSWNFVPTLDSYFWTTLAFTITGFTAAAAGLIVQLVAWVGAVVNTSRLTDKTWFMVVLVGGLIGFAMAPVGFAAMVAYLIAGPDEHATGVLQPPRQESWPATMAPTS